MIGSRRADGWRKHTANPWRGLVDARGRGPIASMSTRIDTFASFLLTSASLVDVAPMSTLVLPIADGVLDARARCCRREAIDIVVAETLGVATRPCDGCRTTQLVRDARMAHAAHGLLNEAAGIAFRPN